MNKDRKKTVDITKYEDAMSCQKFIDKAFQEMDKCIKCGSCCSVCPVFAEHGLEKYVARGKLALCESAVDGTLALTDEFRGVINNCILCMACVENCPNDVQVQQVIIGARALLVQKRGLPMLKQIIFRGMLASRLMMQSVLKTGSLMQWILFQRIPQSSGLRKRFPLPLMDEHRYVPKLARQPFLKQAHEFMEPSRGSQKVIFFCRLFNKLYLPEYCQGRDKGPAPAGHQRCDSKRSGVLWNAGYGKRRPYHSKTSGA